MKLNKNFLESMLTLENEKGIKKEQIIDIIKKAFASVYIKQVLKGGDDAKVEVELDEEKPSIDLYYLRKVVENEDDIQDDYLEISKEDALKIGPKSKVKVGEDFKEKVDLDDFMEKYAKKIMDNMKQKIAEIEKSILFDMYKDKIGEMITGIVEKSDENSTLVNIGRTSVTLNEHAKIGNEKFEVGQQIKLYVKDVSVSTKHGAQILVSRSDKGFLRRLLEEEISEVYDGTVVIKDIARKAGERAKVSVYTNDPNVDPVGSCIGPNGARIQKVMSELFNGRDNERIDVINYSDNPAIYIAESLKPAPILGVNLNEETKDALIVVRPESKSLAIGKAGQNVSLASRLTGWKVKIKDENEASEEGLTYKLYEEVVAEDQKERSRKEYELYLKSLASKQESKPVETSEEHVLSSEVTSNEVKEDKKVEVPSEEVQVSTPVIEEKVEAKVESPSVKQDVQTTKTLEELEKQLEIEKEREEKKNQKPKRTARKDLFETEKVKEKTEAKEDETKKANYMSIYTDEELSQLEEEENYDDYDDYDDDIDYDEYDEYYDDDEGR